MKITTLTIATAAVALLGGAAFAQQPAQSTPTTAPADATAQPTDSSSAAGATTSATSTTETAAPAATSAATNVSATGASFTNMTVTNGPVPDTRENRAKYGQPLSRAGKRTAAKGN